MSPALPFARPYRKRGDDSPRTGAELEAIWRHKPEFVGPVGPPMLLRHMAQAEMAIRAALKAAQPDLFEPTEDSAP